MGNQTGVRNGRLYGGRYTHVKLGQAGTENPATSAESKQPLQQIDDAGGDSAKEQQQQNNAGENHQLKFSVALFTGRR